MTLSKSSTSSELVGRMAGALLLSAGLLATGAHRAPVLAQDEPASMAPGEGFVTRFSGTASDAGGAPVIDLGGVVGSIIDLRALGQPPRGQHIIDEIQHHPITAAQTGQVFGVALGGRAPTGAGPYIYVSATAAFGLHRTLDGADWMAGMWGPDGGPGTIYVLNPDNGYRPEVFARVTLNGRFNSGAALGNIAFDKWNNQLFASDLETGMIHRFSALDGSDLGRWDHGVQGRPNFVIASSGAAGSLPPIAFDPATSAAIDDCPSGAFSRNPECWNVADFRRRVWGLGVARSAAGKVRLYYATWSGQGFDNRAFAGAGEDEKLNRMWSVGLTANGDFDSADIRQEFILPDFFSDPGDIAKHGFSHPVSDIAFQDCGPQSVMLIGERGGLRNLGLDADNPFASPSQARSLRYELDDNGVWAPVGRYDVGNYDRKDDGQPFIRANCAGGVDFGPEPENRNGLVWITGDKLCSPQGPCDESPEPVSGLLGQPSKPFHTLVPRGAFDAYPATGATRSVGLERSYVVDTRAKVDASNGGPRENVNLDDATRIGDVEIYQICATATPEPAPATKPQSAAPASPAPAKPAHSKTRTHRRFGSQQRPRPPVQQPREAPAPTKPMTDRKRDTAPVRKPAPSDTSEPAPSAKKRPPHSRQLTHRRLGSPAHSKQLTHQRRKSGTNN